MAAERILQILSCEPKKDGLTRVALDVGAALKGRFCFEFCAPCGRENDVARRLRQEGAVFHFLPPKRHLMRYIRAIRRIVREGRYDAVYIHGNSAMMIFDAWPVYTAHVPVITHCHNSASNHPLLHRILKPLFNHCVAGKIGCSEQASRWAYREPGIETVPNGIDPEKYAFRPEERVRMRRALGLENCTVVGLAGRLSGQKNPLFALAVFQKILETDKDARLLVLGDGELRGAMTEYIEKHGMQSAVVMKGAVDDPEAYYQAMDLLLVPSLFEGMPLSVLEAQACGLPVLLSEVCSPEVYTLDAVTCRKLSDGAEEWARTAIEICRSGRDRSAGQAVLCQKGFTMRQMTAHIGQVMEKVIGARAGAPDKSAEKGAER